MKCKICGSTKSGICIKAKDLNYGGDSIFEYFQCKKCRCLQIKEVPKDLKDYYGQNYYSLNMNKHKKSLSETVIAKYLKMRDRRLLSGKNDICKTLCCKLQPRAAYEYVRKSCRSLDAAVLDVGCGDGYLLKTMHSVGYTCLTGVDPYLTEKERGG